MRWSGAARLPSVLGRVQLYRDDSVTREFYHAALLRPASATAVSQRRSQRAVAAMECLWREVMKGHSLAELYRSLIALPR